MSVSAAQAAAFYEEILKNGQVWAIHDTGGIPAPLNRGGDRSMPFGSPRSRAEKVIANVPTYAAFEPVAIPVEIWRTRWIDGLQRDGILVGLNWCAARATGYDFRPTEVRDRLATVGSAE